MPDQVDLSSAGVGRTGAFIALSSMLLPAGSTDVDTTSPLGPLPLALRNDKVARVIDEIREWRGYLVQNQEQLGLVYELGGG
jgi:protein-tyrosine phosphatase